MIKLKNSIGLRLLRYVFACYLVVAVAVTGLQLVFEYRMLNPIYSFNYMV
jgi:hypothetical protein